MRQVLPLFPSEGRCYANQNQVMEDWLGGVEWRTADGERYSVKNTRVLRSFEFSHVELHWNEQVTAVELSEEKLREAEIMQRCLAGERELARDLINHLRRYPDDDVIETNPDDDVIETGDDDE